MTKKKTFRPKTECDCKTIACEKQEYIRYAVIKFGNGTYGVLDKNHYGIVAPDNIPTVIHRDESDRILRSGQTTLQKAKKLAKNLNIEIKDTSFQEIK